MVGLSSVFMLSHCFSVFLMTNALYLIQCIFPGVKAGMFVKDAKTRCPQLVIVPYNFRAYEMVSPQL